MKVLIIGGYGRFGGNLAKLLSDCSELHLYIAGRNLEKAKRFCETYKGDARVTPVALNRSNIAPFLETHSPDLVVEASGPFQIYGDAPYGVAIASIEAGIDYVDLADSAEFVANIATLNTAAFEKECFVLSGLSTCPTLSSAAVEALAQGQDITDIKIGIAPSPKAELGLSVVKAILSYAGQKIETLKNGKPDEVIGLTEGQRFQIAPADYPPLENRWFCAVEAPELKLFPKHYPNLQNLWVGAGTRPEALLRLLSVLARLKAALYLPTLTPLAKIAHKVLTLCQYGPHRGGMFVEVKITKDKVKSTQSWHLIAEGDHGPLIPSIATEILIRKILAGNRPANGARAAMNVLTLEEFETQFRKHRIVTRIKNENDTTINAFT